LAAALRAHAEGLYCPQAAVELLIGHRRWLCRDDFLGRFVGLVPETAGGGVFAVVGWRAAVRALSSGRLPCSGSEGSVLRIAASIAGGVPVDLSECLSTLDESTIGLVVDAVLRAGGRTASWGVGAGWGERR
jgi:hypothetical protein